MYPQTWKDAETPAPTADEAAADACALQWRASRALRVLRAADPTAFAALTDATGDDLGELAEVSPHAADVRVFLKASAYIAQARKAQT